MNSLLLCDFQVIASAGKLVTMSVFDVVGCIAGSIGFIATIAASVVVTKSAATKQTILTQKELIDTLVKNKDEQKDQIADLQMKHIESVRALSALQGQVDVLKNIPLKEISTDMKSIAGQMETLSKNQAGILDALRASNYKNGFTGSV